MNRANILTSLLAAAYTLTFNLTSAQVTLVPAFVTQNDTVEVIYDATQGNGALVGVNQVYAHTGVITNLSSTPTSWRHVQGNWGQVDPKVQMTNLGNNLHSIKYHINSFYNVPANETVTHLAFVFRNADGSIVGRTATGGDIFVPISQGGFQAAIMQPTDFGIYNDTDTINISGQTSADADLTLLLNTNVLAQANDTNMIDFELDLSTYAAGRYNIILRAVESGNFYYDTTSFVLRSGPNIAFDTAGYQEGITVLNDSSIALKLRAPLKEYTYVIGDFNDWEVQPAYEMFKTPDGQFFWKVITGLQGSREYAFQYYVGEEGIRIADAYSEKILDPWNDGFIPSSVYPNLKAYPAGKTNFPVSVIQTVKPSYNWQNQAGYQRPASEELVIYELLIRDFDDRHTYLSVIDRLDYLDSLGVNTIQLMPVMEFEGNESWGYNPMFFMAPDKYYGTADDFKALVDSAHGRDMAVILDIALNHAFGQCPLVRLYFDPSAGAFGQPTAQNPWFNEVPKHDFNVGYDFDHSSDATKVFAKRVFQHWVKEFKVDGYRVDLSKGFTQKNTLGNVGAWGQYDQGRINTLQRIKDEVEEIDSTAIMILEHFADNAEEIELSDRGFLLWGNENHEYNEATMGYPSNFSGVYHENRNWNNPYLVGYMESHDEERLMYKNMQFGATNGSYSTKDLATALDRMELGAAFFFTIPGPKMLWQFGETGYDYSINYCPNGTIDPACRTANKPIRWDYLQQQDRYDLFLQYGNLIKLRRSYPNVFQSKDITTKLGGTVKSILLETNDSNAVVIGNFGTAAAQVTQQFPHNGWWYDFNTGDSMMVAGSLDSNFAPGEYHIWLDFKASRSYNNVDIADWGNSAAGGLSVYPNPVKSTSVMNWEGRPAGNLQIKLSSIEGKTLLSKEIQASGQSRISIPIGTWLETWPAGVYLLEASDRKQRRVIQIVRP